MVININFRKLCTQLKDKRKLSKRSRTQTHASAVPSQTCPIAGLSQHRAHRFRTDFQGLSKPPPAQLQRLPGALSNLSHMCVGLHYRRTHIHRHARAHTHALDSVYPDHEEPMNVSFGLGLNSSKAVAMQEGVLLPTDGDRTDARIWLLIFNRVIAHCESNPFMSPSVGSNGLWDRVGMNHS